ncbi:MAG TPA: hypothetical protein VFD58_28365 [Blastocatellia bacterium]|nr:hypothetical protein [Blastocatellia bacterium]
MAKLDHANTSSVRPVTGLFKDGETSGRAYHLLIDMGYKPDDISVVMTDETRSRYFPKDTPLDASSETGAHNKAAAGAAIMGSTGAVLGAVAATGLAIVSGGAGFIVLGPLAAAGAGLGATVGSLFGALIGSSVPNEDVHRYERGIREGRILIRVNPHTEDDALRIEREWQELGGELARF